MGVKRWLVGLVAAGSMLGLAGVSVAPAVAGELAHERLAGPSGVETSLAVAKHTWGNDWKVVYVASNRNPVDALPAATIGDGPVVLTDGKSLNLGGVKPGKIVLLGGIGAVPQTIEDQAKASGVEVVRLAGADRNATAVAIAKQWVKVNGTPKNVYITKNVGSGSPDAVAASVLRDGPILTFTSDASAAALPGVVSELKAGKVTALGGTAVVPDSVLNTAAGGKATARLAGANRYETAFEIAKYAKAQKSGSVVYLASGTALKDAMVAGAAKDGVILLSPANGEGVKAKADALGASKLMIIGGTGVMPDTTVQAATTGVVPKPKLAEKQAKDMTFEDVMALPDGGTTSSWQECEGDSLTNNSGQMQGGSGCNGLPLHFCLGNSGNALEFDTGDYTEFTYPVVHFPELMDMTGKLSSFEVGGDVSRAYMMDILEYHLLKNGEHISPTIFQLDGGTWHPMWGMSTGYNLSACAPGSPAAKYTKPFPLGKRLSKRPERGKNIGSVVCAATEQGANGSVRCYATGPDKWFPEVHKGMLALDFSW